MRSSLLFSAGTLVVLNLSHFAKAESHQVGAFNTSIQTTSGFDQEGIVLTNSSLRFTYGNLALGSSNIIPWDEAVKAVESRLPDLSGGAQKISTDAVLYQVSVAFSGIASASKDRAMNSLMASTDEKIASTRNELITQARTSISHAVNSNPKLTSDAARKAVIESTLQGVIASKIDPALAAKRAEYKGVFDKRTDQVREEAAFQELSLVVVNTNWPVLFKFGKFRPNFDHETSVGGVAGFDPLVLSHQIDRSPLDIMPAAAAQTDWWTETSKGKVTISAFLFHDRPTFINSDQYVGTVATMPDAHYDSASKFMKLDSQALRLLFESKSFSVFVTYGHYKLAREDIKGADAIATGVRYFITPSDILSITYYTGSRYQVENSVNLEYAKNLLGDRLRMTAGLAKVEGYRNPVLTTQVNGTSFAERRVGIAAILAKFGDMPLICQEAKLTGGVDLYSRSSIHDQELLKEERRGVLALLGFHCH